MSVEALSDCQNWIIPGKWIVTEPMNLYNCWIWPSPLGHRCNLKHQAVWKKKGLLRKPYAFNIVVAAYSLTFHYFVTKKNEEVKTTLFCNWKLPFKFEDFYSLRACQLGFPSSTIFASDWDGVKHSLVPSLNVTVCLMDERRGNGEHVGIIRKNI